MRKNSLLNKMQLKMARNKAIITVVIEPKISVELVIPLLIFGV